MDRDSKKFGKATAGSELDAVRDLNRASNQIPAAMLDKLRTLRGGEPSSTPEISVLKIPTIVLGEPNESEAPEQHPRATIPWETKSNGAPRSDQSQTESDTGPSTPDGSPPSKTASSEAPANMDQPTAELNSQASPPSSATPHRPRSESKPPIQTPRAVQPPSWFQSLAPGRDDRAIQEICQRIVTQFPRQAHAQLLFTSADAAVSTNRTVGRIATFLATVAAGDTLLVDANWEANLPIARNRENPQTGLAEVLAQGLDWRPLLVATQTVGLRVLPCGAADVPARQIAIEQLRRLTAEWRRDFEFVLINAGYVKQLLARRIAACCDGAYIMVQLNQTTKADAHAATKVLAENKARTMGAIVFDSASDS